VKVKILGIGGFGNIGLPFNSFLINDHVLVDTPPDILQSLYRESVNFDDIDTIVLTHYHGDHYFGLPFLLFQYYEKHKNGKYEKCKDGETHKGSDAAKTLTIAGPAQLRSKVQEILSLAIAPDHPYVDWCLENIVFREIDATAHLEWADGSWMRFTRSAHTVETYSILSGEGNEDLKPLFVATSDTRWDPALKALALQGPRLLLCDCNGEGFGSVHLSPEEVANYLLPLVGQETSIVATHVSREMPEKHRKFPYGTLEFASCGEVFTL